MYSRSYFGSSTLTFRPTPLKQKKWKWQLQCDYVSVFILIEITLLPPKGASHSRRLSRDSGFFWDTISLLRERERPSNINDSALKRLKWCGRCRRLTSFSSRKMSALCWKGESGSGLERRGETGVKQCHWTTAVSLGVFPQGGYNIHSREIVHSGRSRDIIVPLVPMKQLWGENEKM